jgi:non-heme chloroperoxidase
MGMQGGIKGEYDCIREFSEVDYTADLKKIDKPTLVIHGTGWRQLSISSLPARFFTASR